MEQFRSLIDIRSTVLGAIWIYLWIGQANMRMCKHLSLTSANVRPYRESFVAELLFV